VAENLANVCFNFFKKKVIRLESVPGITKLVKDRMCIVFVTSFYVIRSQLKHSLSCLVYYFSVFRSQLKHSSCLMY